jgi:glycine betaine/proline transport system ATP-binding protein
MLMRALPELLREGDYFILDQEGSCRCCLDPAGRPTNIRVGERPAELVPYATTLDLARLPGHVVVTGDERTPMRAAVQVRQATRRPMLLLGDGGRLLGVVGEYELFKGMLKQTELARSASEISPPLMQ